MKTKISSNFYQDISIILNNARQKVYSTINFAMVEAYWLIGKRIIEEEQHGEYRAKYGKSIIKELALQLTTEFGKGFTETNLKYFRQFYSAFPVTSKSHTVCDQLRKELSWSHYRLIMRIENPVTREYYMREAADFNWSVRQLERNINTLYYERLLSTNQKQEALLASTKMEQQKVTEYLKDPLVLEFLGLPMPPEFSEADFEEAIITNLQKFLLELGKGFSFVGRQYRVTTETKHFYIDLVFYN